MINSCLRLLQTPEWDAMGAVGVAAAIHVPDFEVADLVAFGQLVYEGKVSVSSGKVDDICAIMGIRNVSREELPTETVETARPEKLDLTGQVLVAK